MLTTRDPLQVQGTINEDLPCEDINGISVAPTVETTTGVTYMLDEATICGKLVGNNTSTICTADGVDDIKSYLSRPQVWASGNFTSAPGTQELRDLRDRTDMIGLFGQQAYDRMVGARGFRATLVFKVVVTATPFHQGVASLAFQYGTQGGAGAGNRGNFFYLSTNLPHVKLDLAEHTSAELRVPYVSAYEYFTVPADVGYTQYYGTISLNRLTEFRISGTQIAPRYTMYCWFEDVELIGTYPYETQSVVLQAGSALAELRENRLVSRGLSAVSSIASNLTSVPGLAPLSTNVAWFTRLLAGYASSFGFSKPVDQTIVKRKLISGYGGEAQIDMPSSAFKLTPFQTNELKVGVVSGNTVDEMSFNHILSVPAYIYRKVITDAFVPGDIIYNCLLSPRAMWFRNNSGTGNICHPANATLTTNAIAPAHFLYLGDGFRYWRGGFRFHFKFSKSKLHGGRVVVKFTPLLTTGQNQPITNTQTLPAVSTAGPDFSSYTVLFDLKDGSEFDMDVPFISPTPYVNVNSSIGNLTMFVVSPLNTPSGGSTSIDMAVFVSAMPGFEFAGVVPSMLDGMDPVATPSVYLQAGGVVTTDDASQVTIGERFTSMKQYIMVPDVFIGPDRLNATITSFSMPPWFRKNNLIVNNPISNTAQCVWFGSKAGRATDMYAFANGSTELVFYHDGKNLNTAFKAEWVPSDGALSVTGPGNIYNKGLNTASGFGMFEYVENALRINMPSFAKVSRIPLIPYYVTSGSGESTDLLNWTSNTNFTSNVGRLSFRNNSGAARRLAVQRAAGDDATLGQYIGPPLCVFLQATATVSPNPSAFTL